MSELYAALVAAQAEMPELSKSETAKIETRGGGSFSYSYLGLDALIKAVRPVLSKHGMTVIQAPQVDGTGHFVLTTDIVHSSGETQRFEIPLPVPADADAKAWGSWITYFRRYALLSVLFLAPDTDDDGAAAEKPKPSRAKKPPATEKPHTKGQMSGLKTNLAVLDQEFPEWPGEGRSWADVAREWCKDHADGKTSDKLSMAEMNDLNEWLESKHAELSAGKDVPFS